MQGHGVIETNMDLSLTQYHTVCWTSARSLQLVSNPSCISVLDLQWQGPESSEGKARGAIRAIADARQLRDENSHLQQQLTAQGDLEGQLEAAHHRLEECERSFATVRLTLCPFWLVWTPSSAFLCNLPWQ